MILASLPPESMRRVTVTGSMEVKDFGVFEDHFNSLPAFTEDLLVNPNTRFQEITKKLVQGDVTAELIIRAEWQLDFSVNMHFVANLFDELELVAQHIGGFNIPRDGNGNGLAHLVDHHSGDPDTADIEFSVKNGQL